MTRASQPGEIRRGLKAHQTRWSEEMRRGLNKMKFVPGKMRMGQKVMRFPLGR